MEELELWVSPMELRAILKDRVRLQRRHSLVKRFQVNKTTSQTRNKIVRFGR